MSSLFLGHGTNDPSPAVSLLLASLYEIAISTRAIEAELADIDAKCRIPRG